MGLVFDGFGLFGGLIIVVCLGDWVCLLYCWCDCLFIAFVVWLVWMSLGLFIVLVVGFKCLYVWWFGCYCYFLGSGFIFGSVGLDLLLGWWVAVTGYARYSLCLLEHFSLLLL